MGVLEWYPECSPSKPREICGSKEVRDLCTECGNNTNIRSTVWHYANAPSERCEGWQYDMGVRMVVEG